MKQFKYHYLISKIVTFYHLAYFTITFLYSNISILLCVIVIFLDWQNWLSSLESWCSLPDSLIAKQLASLLRSAGQYVPSFYKCWWQRGWTDEWWNGGDGQGREREDSVLLIYMFIAARREGQSSCLRVSGGHVQLSTLLFPQQHFLTAHNANTQNHRHTFWSVTWV